MNSAPIGFFDSGAGGVSVWQVAAALLPAENTVYLADSANAPYGDRPPTEIEHLSARAAEFLLAQGCKLIVIACNTATVNAAAALRRRFAVPLVGLEPAVKPAAILSKTKHIGLLATRGTLASAHFREHTARLAAEGGAVLHSVAAAGVVDLIERGLADSAEMDALLDAYTAPLAEAGADVVVLGCTHYPFIRDKIAARLPSAQIIDSASAVSRQIARLLERDNLLNTQGNTGSRQWFSTGSAAVLAKFAPAASRITEITLGG